MQAEPSAPCLLTADHDATLVLELNAVISLIDFLPSRPSTAHKLLSEVFLRQPDDVTAGGVAAGVPGRQHSDR